MALINQTKVNTEYFNVFASWICNNYESVFSAVVLIHFNWNIIAD